MELRDLMTLDIESLTATQAQQVARDAIAVLTKGGVTGSEQDQLKTLMVSATEIATGRKIGDSHDNIREEVLQKIKEAEARGDKRTARYLAESMVASDVAAADLAEQELTGAADKFIADDIAASEDRRRKDQQQQIDLRTQELLRVNGSEYGYSPEKARKQAMREIIRPRYEDDINDEPEKPDRQAILDAHKAAL